MQIRTLVVLLSAISAVTVAFVVGYFSIKREEAQTESDALARWEIYSQGLSRVVDEERAGLESFGLNGDKDLFWRPENAQPLNFSRSQNRSNYFQDYSAVASGEIENPMIKSLISGKDLSEAERILKIYFGPALQKGELLFFSVVDASIAPLLWRLPALGIELPAAAAKDINTYAERLFSREAFQQSLTEEERDMRL